MSLFGAKKTPTTLKEQLKIAKKNYEKRMSTESEASAASGSHIGDLIKDCEGLHPTDPDGTATTSEIAQGELGDYLGVQQAAVTLTREQFNQGIMIHNAEVSAEGHPSQVIEPIWGTAEVIDEYENRRSHAVHTISSDDSSLSPPPTTDYGGSEISFPSQTPKEKTPSPPSTMNYEGSLLGIPPSALPQDPFSTPRASVGIIAHRYIQSEENTSQNDENEGGMEETRKVYTPIPRKFKVSDDNNSEDDTMTEVEWRDEEPYMKPTKKGKKCNKGKGVKRPKTPERPILNMPQTPSRKKLEADWAKPAEGVANENKEINLEAFIGEYLRNTNGLRDFMINKAKYNDSYSEWCGEQAGHIAARQNHTDAAVGSTRIIAQNILTEVESEREYAGERAEKLDDRLSKIEKK